MRSTDQMRLTDQMRSTDQMRLTDQTPSIGELLLPARRRFLCESGLGFGSLALASLLGQAAAGNTSGSATAGASLLALPHHLPKASAEGKETKKACRADRLGGMKTRP